MLPRNSSWLRSVFPLVMALLVCCVLAPAAPAEDLNLAGLATLEAPALGAHRSVLNAPAPLDLSGLDQLSGSLTAAGGLQLAALQALECPCPDGCRCEGECRCGERRKFETGKPAEKAAAQLVLPAARPPAAVPATTAAAGGFWQQQCGKRGCRLVWVSRR